MKKPRQIEEPIDSAYFYYFLGLVASDGSVYKTTVSIELHISDAQILQDLFYWMQSLSAWRPSLVYAATRPSVRLRVNSQCLVDLLAKYNIGPKKSKTIQFPRCVSSVYLADYVRGVFDGDGSVYIRRQALHIEFCSGSEQFVEDLTSAISSTTGLSSKTVNQHGSTYRVQYYSNQARKLLQWIYDGAVIKLERKYQVYADFVPAFDKRRTWTQEQEQYLIDHYRPGTDSWKHIATVLGKSEKAVSKRIWQIFS